MVRTNFNDGWAYGHIGDKELKAVTLPHDAMISEPRVPESDGGTNTGWYEGHDYEYVKTFDVPAEYADKCVTLEFEGIYRDAEVFVNGDKVAEHHYGYTGFYVSLDKCVKFGEKNEIKVTAKNADQPNSRWYSGAGIYRPVSLIVSDKEHILINGLKIRPVSISPATVEITVLTTSDGEVDLCITGDKNYSFKATAEGGKATLTAVLDGASLWTPSTPNLYTCTATFKGDKVSENFGVRIISCTPEKGFCLNGERIIICGACIHHDNGILGARCFTEAEERKIKLLKEVGGYNAIRSAHNPCSKAMLDACDKLGVMVMDEYVDMWYIHKTRYDYGTYVKDNYEQDITDMIDKDFSHPSVVMYSLGNEVAETGQKEGIEFFKTMKAVCKKLDPDRPVTAGVNIFFNYLYAMGFGVYSDKKAVDNPQKKVGSEFFNNLAGILGAGFMKTMACLPGCDRKTRECYAAMDAAGYNYGIKRYKGDVKKYPDRVILGSETFCSDAYRFMEFAKDHPSLIGDFVWAGIDYLGELGIGAWEYKEYAPDFLHTVGWMSAGSGRLDLIGNPLGEALYTRVALGLEDKPQIAVVPVSHTKEKHTPSSWKFSNAIPSWSWNGLDGSPAKVEVYSRSAGVALYLNGKLVGKKKLGKNCKFDFKIKYAGGELTAVALDKAGNEIARNSIKTADDETVISLTPELKEVEKGSLAFVKVEYTDKSGEVKPLERGKITVKVEGGELVALGHACPYNADGFLNDWTDTYYGRALAVVRVTDNVAVITADDGKLQAKTEVKAK